MQYPFAHTSCLSLNVLLASILLAGCSGQEAGTSVAMGQDAEEVAVQLRRSRIEGNVKLQEELIAPAHKKKLDFSVMEESVVPKGEIYRSHVSVSADSSFLREKHGHVVVSFERPDLSKMVAGAGLNYSERRSLSTTLEDGDAEVAKNRLEKLVEKAEESLGSVPTSEERKTIPVIKSDDGEWKALIRFIITDQIEEVREELRFSDVGEDKVNTLRDIQNLAPTLGITQTFTRQIVDGRIEVGRDLLQDDNLKEAKEVLAFAKENAPELGKTERFADEVSEAQKEFAYTDNVDLKIISSRSFVQESSSMFSVVVKAEVKNSGDKSFSNLITDEKYHLKTEDGPLADTTLREKNRHFYKNTAFVEKETLEPGDTKTIELGSSLRFIFRDLDAEELKSLKSYQIEGIEVSPARVRLE